MEIKDLHKEAKKLNLLTSSKINNNKKPFFSDQNLIINSDQNQAVEKEIIGKSKTYLKKNYDLSSESIAKIFLFYLFNIKDNQIEVFDPIEVEIKYILFLPEDLKNLFLYSKKIISTNYDFDVFKKHGEERMSNFYIYLENKPFSRFLSYKNTFKVPNFFNAHKALNNLLGNVTYDVNNDFTKALIGFSYDLLNFNVKEKFFNVYEDEFNYEILKNNFYLSLDTLASCGVEELGYIKYKVSLGEKNNYFYLPQMKSYTRSFPIIQTSRKNNNFENNFNKPELDKWNHTINNYTRMKKKLFNFNSLNISSEKNYEIELILIVSMLESIFLTKEDSKQVNFIKRLSVFNSKGNLIDYKSSKKLYQKIYDYRSKAVHGNIFFDEKEILLIKNFILEQSEKIIRSIDIFLLDIIMNKKNLDKNKWLKEIDLFSQQLELEKIIDQTLIDEILPNNE